MALGHTCFCVLRMVYGFWGTYATLNILPKGKNTYRSRGEQHHAPPLPFPATPLLAFMSKNQVEGYFYATLYILPKGKILIDIGTSHLKNMIATSIYERVSARCRMLAALHGHAC